MLLQLAFISLLAATLAAPSPRQVAGQLGPTDRRQLAQAIALDIVARGVPTDDPEQLNESVEEYFADTSSPLRKRLFGWLAGRDSSYAPEKTDCPVDTTFVRPATSISDVEYAHVQSRLSKEKFEAFLSAAGISASTLNIGLDTNVPNVAFAFSGGGYRAMVSGAGQFHAMTPESSEAVAAKTAPIAGLTTYMAGLSGGSWLISSLLANYNDGKLANPVTLANDIWNLESNLLIPDDGFVDNTKYFTKIVGEVGKKRDNFPTQITDYWGLALASHMFPREYGPTEDPSLTMSMLSQIPPASIPYPIIVAAERRPNEIVIHSNATLWEFTYSEFGTWAMSGGVDVESAVHPGLFTPVRYLGSSLDNGKPTNTGADGCWEGFDNLAFVIGTSSTLFNTAYAAISNTSTDSLVVDFIAAILESVDSRNNDIVQLPNPFKGYRPDDNPTTTWDYIDLVDAGLTNQNIPIESFLVSARKVDAVLAFDNSADTTYFWPNGSSLWTTWDRINSLSNQLSLTPSTLMPEIPDVNTFVNLGLNQHPTFFGCSDDARANTTAPLLIYVPNYPWSTYSNKSTFQFDYATSEAQEVIANGARTLTLNNTLSDTWTTCLACAFADRAVARGGSERSETCKTCFKQWCWDGTYSSAAPTAEYEPVVGTMPKFLADLGARATPANMTEPSTANDVSESSALDVRIGGLAWVSVVCCAVVGFMVGL